MSYFKQPDGSYVQAPLHEWFGLSYASYLVVPRLALEALSVDWQHRFVALMTEAEDAGLTTPSYHVLRDDLEYTLVSKYDPDDESSRDYEFTAVDTDPWADYRRGDAAALAASKYDELRLNSRESEPCAMTAAERRTARTGEGE